MSEADKDEDAPPALRSDESTHGDAEAEAETERGVSAMAVVDRESLQAEVRRFCDGADASSASLLSAVLCSAVSLPQLVQAMQQQLTAEDAGVRQRALLLLADVVRGASSSLSLSPAQLDSLCVFFTARLADEETVREALLCWTALLQTGPASGLRSEHAMRLLDCLLSELPVQSFVQSVRKALLDAVSIALSRFPLLAAEQPERVILGFCSAVDGEKDPRCLLVAFSLAAFLCQQSPSAAVSRCSERLLDALGCYFPITFTPPARDPHAISQEELQRGLRAALTAHPALALLALPLFMEKAEEAAAASVRLDALRSLHAALEPDAPSSAPAVSSWSRTAMLPLAADIARCLKKLWTEAKLETEAQRELGACVTAFARCLAEAERPAAASSPSPSLAAFIADWMEDMRVPESRLARAAAAMAEPIAAAGRQRNRQALSTAAAALSVRCPHTRCSLPLLLSLLSPARQPLCLLSFCLRSAPSCWPGRQAAARLSSRRSARRSTPSFALQPRQRSSSVRQAAQQQRSSGSASPLTAASSSLLLPVSASVRCRSAAVGRPAAGQLRGRHGRSAGATG